MKKLLLISLLLTSRLIAQPLCYVIQINNPVVYPGDSAWVGILATDGIPAAFTDTCRIYIQDYSGGLFEVYHKSYWNTMNSTDKYWDGTDSLTKCRFIIPNVCSSGPAIYMAHDNSKNFTINSLTTGIREYDKPKQLNSYSLYNILGQRIK